MQDPKKSPKIAIWASSHNFVGLYLRNWGMYRHSTIGKKLKQQYLVYVSPQYGELRPTSGWDPFVSLGHPTWNFNRFRVLAALLHGTLVVGVSQTAALNRGRHLYSAGRPWRWALAHILVYCVFVCLYMYGYGFLSGGKRQRRETLHATSTTILDELLPFWRSKVKVTRVKKRA